jgi:hypothetical protein
MLSDAARAAYVHGFIVLCVLCGLFVLAAAGVTLLLRDKLQPPR